MIKIWESQRESSLVRSRVAKCASIFLPRFVVVKWEFVFVTLGDRHHLDGLVVIGSLVIIQRSLWMTQLKLWAVVDDSPRRSVEESIHREHLILARINGELHPYVGAPMRTSGEWWLSDTSAKHRRVPFSLYLLWAFTLSIYFEQFNTCFTSIELLAKVSLEHRLRVRCALVW